VLESVAYAGEEIEQITPEGMPLQFPKTGNFLGVVGNRNSIELVGAFRQAAERHEIPLPMQTLVVPGDGEDFPDTRRSDHSRFWDAGYKGVMLTDTCNFRNPHYHQPTDTLDTLNLDFAANVCRALAAAVADLAGSART